jgi:hypothetical protein
MTAESDEGGCRVKGLSRPAHTERPGNAPGLRNAGCASSGCVPGPATCPALPVDGSYSTVRNSSGVPQGQAPSSAPTRSYQDMLQRQPSGQKRRRRRVEQLPGPDAARLVQMESERPATVPAARATACRSSVSGRAWAGDASRASHVWGASLSRALCCRCTKVRACGSRPQTAGWPPRYLSRVNLGQAEGV